MFQLEISEQVPERSASCSVSTRESADHLREFSQVRDLHMVDHLLVHRLQVTDYFTLQMHFSRITTLISQARLALYQVLVTLQSTQSRRLIS